MSTENKEQVAELTAQVNALEEESTRLLSSLQWSSTVRNILLLCLVGFVVVFAFLYYKLYTDIRDNKITQIQQMFVDRQAEFIDPASERIQELVKEISPDVAKVFQSQLEKDGRKYIAAFNQERAVLTKNLEDHIQMTLDETYGSVLDDHEKILQDEFPELESENSRRKIRNSMESAYKQLAKQYYTDYFHKEIENMTTQIDEFPMAEADDSKGPLASQIVYEMLELVQMMMVDPGDDVKRSSARDNFSTDTKTQKSDANNNSSNAESTNDDESNDDDSNDDDSNDDDSNDDDSGDNDSGDDKSNDDSGDNDSGDDKSNDDSGDDNSGEESSTDDDSSDSSENSSDDSSSDADDNSSDNDDGN